MIPEVDVTVDGTPSAFQDSGQVLNTGGIDKAACPSGTNESTQWTPIGQVACAGASLNLVPASQTLAVGATAAVQATFANSCGQGLSNTAVTFSVLTGPNQGASGSGTTDSKGNATFTYTSSRTGVDAVEASVSNPAGNIPSNSVAVNWIQHNTALAVNGGSGDYDDPATLSATLTDTTANVPVSGAAITLGLNGGAQTCNATTNASGVGQCSVTPRDASGNYPISVSYSGGGPYLGSTGPGTFNVTLEQTTLAITSANIAPAGTVNVSAKLLEDGATAISGRSVTFGAGSATATGITDANGVASASLPLGVTVFSVGATFAGDNYYQPATASPVAVPHATALSKVAGNGDYNDASTVSAVLTDVSVAPMVPLVGQAVSMSLNGGAPTCGTTTDSSGKATCSVTPNEPAGGYPLTASFAGIPNEYLPSTGAGTFAVTWEETALGITSSSTLPNGNVVVKAVLKEDATSPIAGRTVTFSAGGLTATGTTDASGTASATLPLAPGQYTLDATFAGDTYYRSATATAQTLYVYQPTQFVIWGGNPGGPTPNVAIGQDYAFWGAQWAKQVTGGDFQANSSFKGYADQVNGTAWTSRPGDSSTPPASVASYVGVLVATQASKDGSAERGNVAEVVVLRVDNPAGYAPDPGHPGSGILVATAH